MITVQGRKSVLCSLGFLVVTLFLSPGSISQIIPLLAAAKLKCMYNGGPLSMEKNEETPSLGLRNKVTSFIALTCQKHGPLGPQRPWQC